MPELRLTHGLSNIGTISPSPATPSQNHHVQKPPPNATQHGLYRHRPAPDRQKTPPAGRFHPIPRGFPYGVQTALPWNAGYCVRYRHGDQCHRRTGRDAGEEEQHRQDRVIEERIRFQRRQQKAGISPQQHRQHQHQCFQSAMNGRQQAQNLLHDPQLRQPALLQASKSCSNFRQPQYQHHHVELKQHHPHRHHRGKTVVEHQLPEGPRSCQVEDEDQQTEDHPAPGPTISVVRSNVLSAPPACG